MLQIGAALFYYKLGQIFLQIGASVVKNWGSYYKLGNRYYKIGQLLQTGAKRITNCGSYYKLLQIGEQFLQIGA